jgi:CheY-like chemotaxis protein
MIMPGVSGPEFISHLKEYYSKWTPVIIVISSLGQGNEILNNTGLKFNYFIQKPFEISDLTGVIEHIQNSKK